MKGFIGMGRMISKLRKNKGYTQTSFAHAIGQTRSNWCRIEHDKRRLSFEMMSNVAGALNLDTEVLVLLWLRHRYPNLNEPQTVKQVAALEQFLGV